MNKSKIEWCERTWNPITGCLHECEYCYARKMVHRYGGASETHHNETVGVECQWCTEETGKLHILNEPLYNPDKGRNAPYPYGFDPTLHCYRLDQPQKIKKPQNVFVCSMADMFGAWVPDSWINEIFDSCEKAPQHNYLFLTKNPMRYLSLAVIKNFPLSNNFWYGTSITTSRDVFMHSQRMNTFLSIEPLLGAVSMIGCYDLKWVIIGAETGTRKNRVVPKREWVESIIEQCRNMSIPVFVKNNLSKIYPDLSIQEYPGGLNTLCQLETDRPAKKEKGKKNEQRHV